MENQTRGFIFLYDGHELRKPLGDAVFIRLLENIPKHQVVQAFRVPGNNLTDASCGKIREWVDTRGVRMLILDHNDVTEGGVANIVEGALADGELELLSCRRCLISSSPLFNYAVFGPHSPLLFVDLSGNDLGDEGAIGIANWMRENTLLSLSLKNCGIHDKGLEALAISLESNRCLRDLRMSNNPVCHSLKKNKTFARRVLTMLALNTSLVTLEIPELFASEDQTLSLKSCLKSQNNLFRQIHSSKGGLAFLSNRSWTHVPGHVMLDKVIVKLDVSFNNLEGLPYSMVNLVNLTWLNVSNNLISESGIPYHLRELRLLNHLFIDGNPICSQIPSVFSWKNNIDHLFEWFDILMEKEVRATSVKVAVVGNKKSGKTCLINSLTKETQSKKKAKKKKKMGSPSEAALTFVDCKINSGDGRSASFTYWDFNSLTIPVHEFFMTEGALFVVVLDGSSSDLEAQLLAWKHEITAKVEYADIFVVVTRKDSKFSGATQQFIAHQREAVVGKKKVKQGRRLVENMFMHGIYEVDAREPGEVMEQLNRKMVQVGLLNLSKQGGIPFAWKVARTVVLQERESLDYPVVTFSQFENLAFACGIEVEDAVELAQFLHKEGSVLYYSNHKVLQKYVVLDPAWLVDILIPLTNTDCNFVTRYGTFHEKDVGNIWPPYKYPIIGQRIIIEMLSAFEVIHGLGSVYVVPALVPGEPPVDVLNSFYSLKEDHDLYERVFVFGSSITALHNLKSLMIIRMLSICTKASHIWQNGVAFTLEDGPELHRVVLKFSDNGRELILVVATKNNAGKCLYILHSAIEGVLDGWYKNLDYECVVLFKDGARFSLEELGKILLNLGGKVNFAVDVNAVPDLLMRTEYRIDFQELKEEDFIASGSFGSVCKATYQGEQVAVKRMMSLESLSEPDVYSQFLKECWVMSFLEHECVIKLKGISLKPLCLVMEYMNLRDLRHFLDVYALPPWEWRVKILMDVARGMDYAHNQFPPIIHRDLKSPNIFLDLRDGLLFAKVADLGLATVLPRLAKHAVVDNPTWSAPEVIRGDEYSSSADVYSFGICMWEVLSGVFPFEELWETYTFSTDVISAILKGQRPNLTAKMVESAPEGYVDLMKEAWHKDENLRPNFFGAFQRLKKIDSLMKKKEKNDASDVHEGALKRLRHFLNKRNRCVGICDEKLIMFVKRGSFVVVDLLTARKFEYFYPKKKFSCKIMISKQFEGALWCSGKHFRDVLVVRPNGFHQVLTGDDHTEVTDLCVVDDKMWVASARSRKSCQSVLSVWDDQTMVRYTVREVAGILRNGLFLSNHSVIYTLEGSKSDHFLWNVQVPLTDFVKLVELPSRPTCIIDVPPKNQIWVCCMGCMLRFTYTLQLVTRVVASPSESLTGCFSPSLGFVLTIGREKMVAWNLDKMQISIVKRITAKEKNEVRSLSMSSSTGESISIERERSNSGGLSTMVFNRNPNLKMDIDSANQSNLSSRTASKDNSEDSNSNNYNFTVDYSGKSKPMGFKTSMSSSEEDDKNSIKHTDPRERAIADAVEKWTMATKGSREKKKKNTEVLPSILMLEEFGQFVTSCDSVVLWMVDRQPKSRFPLTEEKIQRRAQERQATILEDREKETRSMIGELEKHLGSKDGEKSDYKFAKKYSGPSRPMGFEALDSDDESSKGKGVVRSKSGRELRKSKSGRARALSHSRSSRRLSRGASGSFTRSVRGRSGSGGGKTRPRPLSRSNSLLSMSGSGEFGLMKQLSSNKLLELKMAASIQSAKLPASNTPVMAPRERRSSSTSRNMPFIGRDEKKRMVGTSSAVRPRSNSEGSVNIVGPAVSGEFNVERSLLRKVEKTQPQPVPGFAINKPTSMLSLLEDEDDEAIEGDSEDSMDVRLSEKSEATDQEESSSESSDMYFSKTKEKKSDTRRLLQEKYFINSHSNYSYLNIGGSVITKDGRVLNTSAPVQIESKRTKSKVGSLGKDKSSFGSRESFKSVSPQPRSESVSKSSGKVSRGGSTRSSPRSGSFSARGSGRLKLRRKSSSELANKEEKKWFGRKKERQSEDEGDKEVLSESFNKSIKGTMRSQDEWDVLRLQLSAVLKDSNGGRHRSGSVSNPETARGRRELERQLKADDGISFTPPIQISGKQSGRAIKHTPVSGSTSGVMSPVSDLSRHNSSGSVSTGARSNSGSYGTGSYGTGSYGTGSYGRQLSKSSSFDSTSLEQVLQMEYGLDSMKPLDLPALYPLFFEDMEGQDKNIKVPGAKARKKWKRFSLRYKKT